jgi:hypothetical protein
MAQQQTISISRTARRPALHLPLSPQHPLQLPPPQPLVPLLVPDLVLVQANLVLSEHRELLQAPAVSKPIFYSLP